jgi:hypothetical protein
MNDTPAKKKTFATRFRRIPWIWVIVLVVLGGYGVGFWLFRGRMNTVALGFLVVAGMISLVFQNSIRGVRTSIWSLSASTATVLCYIWIFTLSTHWYFRVALLAFVAAPLAMIANAAYRSDQRRSQEARDVAATELNDNLDRLDSETSPFTLYLRPFSTTDRLEAQYQGSPYQFEVPTHLDLESLLTRAMRKKCPLVALGREGDIHEGAGRITVPTEDWQEAITRLASHAAILVIVPSARQGTLWELKHLADNGLLSRTLFVMPEQPRTTPSGVLRTIESDRLFEAGIRTYNEADHTFDIVEEWAKATEACNEIPLHLPAYSPAGALFTLDQTSRNVIRIAPLALSILTRKITYLRAVIGYLGLWSWTKESNSCLAEELEKSIIGGGRTLEYALVVAGDAYLSWGMAADALELFRRAYSVCKRPRIFMEYVQTAGTLACEQIKKGDSNGALLYFETVIQLQKEFNFELSEQQAIEEAISLCSRGDTAARDLQKSGQLES